MKKINKESREKPGFGLWVEHPGVDEAKLRIGYERDQSGLIFTKHFKKHNDVISFHDGYEWQVYCAGYLKAHLDPWFQIDAIKCLLATIPETKWELVWQGENGARFQAPRCDSGLEGPVFDVSFKIQDGRWMLPTQDGLKVPTTENILRQLLFQVTAGDIPF